MNLLKNYKTARQLSKWRKQITHNQKVLVCDGQRIFTSKVTGFAGSEIRVEDPDHFGLIWVYSSCVFPFLNH